MPWSPEQKTQSREKILTSAAHLFTHKGFERVSINEVMSRAGLTRGAFYKHFASKADLYSEAVVFGAKRMSRGHLSKVINTEELIDIYLSKAHVSSIEDACPLAFLVSDIAQQETASRDGYNKVLKGFVNGLSNMTQCNDDKALISCILMIGGVALARAVGESDFADKILITAKEEIKSQLKLKAGYE
ncbi:transcriptional regulator, TetR family [Oceanospirillum multiglobuliferum]|uniref:HTH tetR-type domain-containing protein n=1 Tax=Oceanospirillum multiglobuliferum TaxID=64969 RepID=A0A1T4SGY8_9GAMM|nr:TetR/AcrR family transcriptional regulator [Oceanospirillum multiglobuliferum]OPX54245.1 hypothetical protein BTE48_15210 [Oceanospirillum multiglobuliferum]SKA27455.1 transcriptional regulator, TetR family [Oceanospirillum multiglobuliferum]